MAEGRERIQHERPKRASTSRKVLSIGIDLGGTKIVAGLVSKDGRLLHGVKEQTHGWGDPNDVVEQLSIMVRYLIDRADSYSVGPIGIGAAAQIEEGTGAVTFAPNLGWSYFPLRERLEEVLGLPLLVTNDVRAAAFGEWHLGAGKGFRDLVLVFVGTGIGGSVISSGRLLTGHANTAGELGHTTVLVGGPKCRCPNYGCLEAVAGGWAIALRAQELIAQHRLEGAALLDLADGDINRVTARMVCDTAQRGDLLAQRVIDEAVAALIAGCTSFANAFSPRRIILGGGVIEGYPDLVARVEGGVRERALPAVVKDLEVVKASLGNDAGVIGAAAMARVHFSRKGLSPA